MEYYLKVLKQYAVFEGRARRSEYWYFTLFNSIIGFVLGLVGEFSGSIISTGLYQLAVFIPSIAVGVRRLHDVNKSGWFLLIPIYNLILLVSEGDRGDNYYGSDPKNPGLGNDSFDQLV